MFNGQEIWIGNEDFETDENAQYSGVLKNLEAAIDKVRLAGAGGPGSKAILVSYSTGAALRVLDLEQLSGASLGSQKDYKGKIGTDMVQGVVMAAAELSKAVAARKVLIVIGDGNDTNNEAARPALASIAADLEKQHIGLYAIVYKSAISSEGDVIKTVVPGAKTVNSVDGIAVELSAILAKLR